MRELRIDLGRICSNYLALKSAFGPAKVMAVVKANAYGHGIIEVANALDEAGVDVLGVADLDEAISLRLAGIRAPVMCWLLDEQDDLQSAVEHNIILGISTIQQLESVPRGAIIHLKVDTGLGRNGFMPDRIPDVVKILQDRRLKVQGLLSHLANTSEAEDLAQQVVFDSVYLMLEQAGVKVDIKHLAASAAAISYPGMRYDMVRCGIVLYGLNPFEDRALEGLAVRPVMSAVAKVANLKSVPAGQGVSYGYRYKTDKPTKLALVPFGYAEGMPRISQGARVKIGQKLFPVVGRIAMDQFVVDVGDSEISMGDEVVIFGDSARNEPTAETLAESAGTVNYEVVTRVGGRANRVFLEP
ncbi:MAG: alanine racemase [Aquiluna sp.]|jgi:alanine racemase